MSQAELAPRLKGNIALFRMWKHPFHRYPAKDAKATSHRAGYRFTTDFCSCITEMRRSVASITMLGLSLDM